MNKNLATWIIVISVALSVLLGWLSKFDWLSKTRTTTFRSPKTTYSRSPWNYPECSSGFNYKEAGYDGTKKAVIEWKLRQDCFTSFIFPPEIYYEWKNDFPVAGKTAAGKKFIDNGGNNYVSLEDVPANRKIWFRALRPGENKIKIYLKPKKQERR